VKNNERILKDDAGIIGIFWGTCKGERKGSETPKKEQEKYFTRLRLTETSKIFAVELYDFI
jgi:molybdopterin synthase catalytic subunit